MPTGMRGAPLCARRTRRSSAATPSSQSRFVAMPGVTACANPRREVAAPAASMTSSTRRGKITLQHSELKPTSLSTLSAVSRTSPCPCGSGKRYKDCHGALQAGRNPPASADWLLSEAEVAFVAGRHRDAAASLRRLLEVAPDNVAAWNLLGTCLKPTDDAAASEAWWRALDVDPEN